MNAVVWVVLALVPLLAVAVFLARPLIKLETIKRQVRRKFPTVEQLAGAELGRQLAAGESIVLVDVRHPDEYAVSHLPGAVHLDPRELEPRLPGVDPDARIVTYCSVGWRSSQMVERLKAAGYQRAANLEGSIFQWAREGRSLMQGDRPVRKVHPYSAAWAFLVPRSLRAFAPSEAVTEE